MSIHQNILNVKHTKLCTSYEKCVNIEYIKLCIFFKVLHLMQLPSSLPQFFIYHFYFSTFHFSKKKKFHYYLILIKIESYIFSTLIQLHEWGVKATCDCEVKT